MQRFWFFGVLVLITNGCDSQKEVEAGRTKRLVSESGLLLSKQAEVLASDLEDKWFVVFSPVQIKTDAKNTRVLGTQTVFDTITVLLPGKELGSPINGTGIICEEKVNGKSWRFFAIQTTKGYYLRADLLDGGNKR